MKKRILSIGLMVAILASVGFLLVGATKKEKTMAVASQLEGAPLNPNFLKYLEEKNKGTWNNFTEDGYGLGHITAPVDLSHLQGGFSQEFVTVPPSSWNVGMVNRMVPTDKDQTSCGACWTFAAAGSSESNLRPGIVQNLSEQHLNKYHTHDWIECEGGNSNIAVAHTAQWADWYDESAYPYPYSGVGSDSGNDGAATTYHLHQAQWSGTDKATIKNMLMTHGAAYISYYTSSSYYDTTNWAYYYPYAHSSNHAITLIGWDDDYSKTNFKTGTQPSGNGAWLVRNSWGSSWGNTNKFWLSYYDQTWGGVCFFNKLKPRGTYGGMYQYDPLGWTSSWGFSDLEVWTANCWTTTKADKIVAVGFYTTDAASYTVRIYKGCSTSDPTSGTLMATKSGTTSTAGYYTVDLTSPVSLAGGQKFSVVIEFNNSSYIFPMAIEEKIPGYSSAATSAAGQSFYSHYGTSWSDLYTDFPTNAMNQCIKVYSEGACVPNTKEDLVGSWSNGAWMANSDTWGWTKMTPSSPSMLGAGDYDGDCIDDIWGVWPSGCWILKSSDNLWYRFYAGAPPHWMYIADMNGDGMPDFLGSWNDGVWYWSSGQKTWHRMTSNSAEIVAAADLDGDGKADLIGNWAAQGGVWIKFSTSNNWVRVASDATWLYGGDMNGNGREDLLGNWAGGECYFEGQKEGSSSGVYMMDVKDMIWKRLVGPSQMIAAGDFDGDNTDDLIIKWTDDHVWLKLSNTGWKRLNASTGSKWLSAGHMRPAGGGSQLLWLEPETSLPSDAGIAGLAFDPIMTKDFIDLTEILPGGPMGESLEYITTEENLEVGLEIDRAMQKKFTNIIVEKEKKKKIIRK